MKPWGRAAGGSQADATQALSAVARTPLHVGAEKRKDDSHRERSCQSHNSSATDALRKQVIAVKYFFICCKKSTRGPISLGGDQIGFSGHVLLQRRVYVLLNSKLQRGASLP